MRRGAGGSHEWMGGWENRELEGQLRNTGH